MQVLSIEEVEVVSGGDFLSFVGSAVVTVGSAQVGAYYGAQVGWIGGPAGAVAGAAIGAGAAYLWYNYVA